MVKIIPAILATSSEQFKEDLEKIKSSPSLEGGWLHVDFADGVFVSNKTISADYLKERPMNLSWEAHLMVNQPKNLVNELKERQVKRIIVHVENEKESIEDVVSFCKAQQIEFGLAIKMDTPLEKIDPYWDIIDLVLIMSVEPGFQGQPFLDRALERIKEVAKLKKDKNLDFKIGVDGHINADNARQVIDSGADNLVIGSYLLNGDIEENVETLWEKINS